MLTLRQDKQWAKRWEKRGSFPLLYFLSDLLFLNYLARYGTRCTLVGCRVIRRGTIWQAENKDCKREGKGQDFSDYKYLILFIILVVGI